MIKVKLRQKPIKGNLISLYLDFYPPIIHPDTGEKKRREFLGIHLYSDLEFKEESYMGTEGKCSGIQQTRLIPVLDKYGQSKKANLSAIQKKANKDAMDKAEETQAERQLMIFRNDFSFMAKNQKSTDFIEYFARLADERSGGNLGNWSSTLQHLKAFRKVLPVSELNVSICEDFKKFLLAPVNKLSQNSAGSYFSKFKAALTQAYITDRLITFDLARAVPSIKEEDSERNYLTQEELKALIETPCREPILKKAAIFSAITSLRWSDIEKLTWSEVQHSDANGYSLQFTQKKTKKRETTPIPENVLLLMGEKGKPDDKVFPGLVYSAHKNKILHQWVKDAGITKHVVFHSFRHTNATIALEKGIDIYTQSKKMGHSSISETEGYSKVRNPALRKAADVFNSFDLSKI